MKQKYLKWIFYSVLIVTISAMVSVLIVSGANYGAWDFDYTNEYESGEVISGEDLSFEDESDIDVPGEDAPVEDGSDVDVPDEDVSDEDESNVDAPDEDATDEDVENTTTPAETTTTPAETTTTPAETTTTPAETTTTPAETTTEKNPEDDKTESVLISVSDDAVVNSEAFCVTISTAKNYYADVVAMFGNDRVEIYSADGYEIEDDAYVGTGCVIRLYNGDEYIEYTVIVMCDLDGNGRITANDARETLRGATGLVILSDIQTVAGNINNDDNLTASDARKVLRKAAGLDL